MIGQGIQTDIYTCVYIYIHRYTYRYTDKGMYRVSSGVSELGACFWGPSSKDHSVLGVYVGVPVHGNYYVCSPRLAWKFKGRCKDYRALQTRLSCVFHIRFCGSHVRMLWKSDVGLFSTEGGID